MPMSGGCGEKEEPEAPEAYTAHRAEADEHGGGRGVMWWR